MKKFSTIIIFIILIAILSGCGINASISKIKSAAVGDIVTFGKYEQDDDTSNGEEEIEWKVLAIDENKALLISEYCLDCIPYDDEQDSETTWEECALRRWLNSDFISTAFSKKELKSIALSSNNNGDNSDYPMARPCGTTEDNVFLLSISETENYITSDEYGKAAATPYAIARGVWTSDEYSTVSGEATTWWWLRSSSFYRSGAAYVRDSGTVNGGGNSEFYGGAGIRPALWVNLK